MTVESSLWIALAVAAALIVGFAVLYRGRSGHGVSSAELSAAEARVDELRRRITELQEQLFRERQEAEEVLAARAAAAARLEEALRSTSEQRALVAEAQAKLTDAFRGLAAEALQTNRSDFVASAREQMRPLQEALEAYQREGRRLEEARQLEMGKVQEQYRELAAVAVELQKETGKLVNAFRSPHVRGRWGQLTLRRTAELAGMVPYCDFYEQESLAGEQGRLRPDMRVQLPNRRHVLVDSKVPLDAYLDATAAATEQEREAAFDRHSRQTREHVVQLASKEYHAHLSETPEFVVMFIPNDSFLAAAVERLPDLVEFALTRGVVVATPPTFVALLRAIAYGWRQAEFAENARHISALGRTLAERLATFVDHVDHVGSGLRRAVESYNEAVGSLEARVLPAARRLRDVGIIGSKELGTAEPVDLAPRAVALPSLPEGAQPIFPEEELSGPSVLDASSAAGSLTSQFDAANRGSFTCRCRICGSLFEGAGPRSQYCSESCREQGRTAAPEAAQAAPPNSDQVR